MKDGEADVGGIPDMARRFPQARVKQFVGSAHSIHNTRRQEFISDLKALVDEVSSA